MSLTEALLIAEAPVCTLAILTSAGWAWRRARARQDVRDVKSAEHTDKVDQAMAVQSQGLAVLVAQVNPMIASVNNLALRTGSLEATTAALLATVEGLQSSRNYRHHVSVRPSPRPW